ncbi:MAG: ABC transporter permease [Actinomycetota bacterium]
MKPTMFRRLLQIATFLRKESIDVLRQPRLLLTLVIGPFLIMAVFGIGYRDTAKPMRTLFVGPAGSPMLEKVDTFAKQMGDYVDYAGVSNDPVAAQRRLLAGDIDLIVTFPDDPIGTVEQGQQATITVVHTRLDPIERTAIDFASQLAVAEINGQVLAAVVQKGKEFSDPAAKVLETANQSLASLDSAINSRDPNAVRQSIEEVQTATDDLSGSWKIDSALADRLAAARSSDAAIAAADANLTELRDAVNHLDAGATAQDVANVRTSMEKISSGYEKLRVVNPAVLVRPFKREVRLAVAARDNVTDWYAPAAIVLMLQQFGVAFGALSFVRERQLGIVEVLRVAPVNASEALIGKYLAYLLIGSAVAASLTAMVVLGLGVPIAGSVGAVAIAIGLSLFASVGIGFVISLASTSDAQAVQYTMIVLLASLFFSGFFLATGQMEGAAKVAGYLLPVRYGMTLLRDVMLRGAGLDRAVTLQLFGYGVVMFAIALLGTRRRLQVAR